METTRIGRPAFEGRWDFNTGDQRALSLMAQRFGTAVELERRAVDLRPNFGVAWRTFAAAGRASDVDVAERGAASDRK